MPNKVVLHDWSNGDAEGDSYPVRLGRGIAAMRKRRQLSRKALANRLRVRTGAVGAWERGEHVPPGDKTIQLLLVLEVTPAELLAAGERASTRLRSMEGRGPFERRRTMSDETSEMEQEPTPPVTGEDPDLKSERVQDE